jgi:hypothetical protein
VSGATRNLKEAAGKTLARRTEIAYEAGISGREGTVLQSPITIQEDVSVYAAGIWSEGHAHYPGEICCPALGEIRGMAIWRQIVLMFGRSQQKPYEPD